MTTLAQAKEAVYARFVANYTGVTVDRITFDNEEFNEPGTGNWVRLTVRSGPRLQDTLGKTGNRRYRSSARVLVQVYTPANTGVQQGDTLATEARDVFEGVSFSGLDFTNGQIRESGPDGRWYQHIADIEFDFDEIK